jgi:phosphatidylethanolamine-binding protein (PEBP) family uncharacterized protein
MKPGAAPTGLLKHGLFLFMAMVLALGIRAHSSVSQEPAEAGQKRLVCGDKHDPLLERLRAIKKLRRVSSDPAVFLRLDAEVKALQKQRSRMSRECRSLKQAQALSGFSIRSPVFGAGGRIPDKYTCFDYGGRQPSGAIPPLSISGVPAGAKRLVLVMSDADADDFLHWIAVINKNSPAWSGFKEATAQVSGVSFLANYYGVRGYAGPCPSTGTHRYSFRLYAISDTRRTYFGSSLAAIDRNLSRVTVRGGRAGYMGRVSYRNMTRPTNTPSPIRTATASATPIPPTFTPSPPAAPTFTPTWTLTPISPDTPTSTATATPTGTSTSTPTTTPTATPTPTSTTALYVAESWETAFPPAGWSAGTRWARSGTYGATNGVYAARAATVSSATSSVLTRAPITFSKTTNVSFYWKIDAEPDYGFAFLCVNRATCALYSNQYDWYTTGYSSSWYKTTLTFAAGTYTFAFGVQGDGYPPASGSNHFLLDFVEFDATGVSSIASTQAVNPSDPNFAALLERYPSDAFTPASARAETVSFGPAK